MSALHQQPLTLSADFSEIDVWVVAAFYHEWEKGRTLRHDPSLHPHATREFQLWFVRKGCIELHAANRQWWINAGEACLLPMNAERDITTHQETVWWSVRLGSTVFSRFSLISGIPLPVQWRPEAAEGDLMESWMSRIYYEHNQLEEHRRLVANGLATALLGICWPHASPAPMGVAVHSGLPSWLVQTLQRVKERPDTTVAELAHASGFSPAQFRRSFRRYLGSAPQKYLKTKRLEAAKFLLLHTSLPVRAIAEQIGFYDAGYFARLFKSEYGASPAHYRTTGQEFEGAGEPPDRKTPEK